MASDDSHGNVSTMAAQEPHADPELLPLPASPMEARNTEEFANIFARFVRLARSPGLFRSLTPRGSNVFMMNVRLGGEFPGAGGVGADSGFVGVPASGDAMAALPETTVGEGGAPGRRRSARCASRATRRATRSGRCRARTASTGTASSAGSRPAASARSAASRCRPRWNRRRTTTRGRAATTAMTMSRSSRYLAIFCVEC